MGLYKVCGCGSSEDQDRVARRKARRAAWLRCRHNWFYTFTLPGQKAVRKGTMFRDKKSAQTELEEAKRNARLGQLGLAAAAPVTLSEFAREFLDRDVAVNTPRTLDRYEGAFTRVKAALGDRLLQDITTDDVQGYKADRMKDGMKPATINRELAFLRRVFNVALQRNRVSHTPFRHNGVVVVRLLREDNQRERYLTDEEETRLRAACEVSRCPWLLSVVVTALHAGMRRNEILTLRWRDVDLAKRRIVIRATNAKSHRKRVIPINDKLHTVLSGQRLDSAGAEKSAEALVFTNEADEPIKSLRTAWEGARDGAGLVNFRFHDLRHTFASRLVERGVPLLHVSKLLGHSTILMTQRYSHASEDALHDAVSRLDRPVEKFNVDSKLVDPVVSETPVTAVH